MISYKLEVSMADKNLKITNQMYDIICDCCNQASQTIVAKREKRTYTVTGRKDEYTIYLTLTSRDAVLPNRSLSTLTRKVTANEYMQKILEHHTPNGCVFKTNLLHEDTTTMRITHQTDTEIVSEIISIFFEKTMSKKKLELASTAAENIRNIVIQYLNDKMNL